MTTYANGSAPVTAERPRHLAADGGAKAVTLPYKERWRHLRWRDAVSIFRCVRRGVSTLPTGEWPLAELEQKFKELTGCTFALAMNSGTAALHSALFAVGVGPGDEVVVPSYTWHATASAILCCGGKPVFCDINPRTLTADPEDIARRITPRTKAVMVVHGWGNPAEMDAISAITQQHKVPLIEDCSHAHGASYQGKPIGAWGDIGCFSLQGAKAVSAGEGGIAVCSDRQFYERMLALGHPLRTQVEIEGDRFALGAMHLGPKYRPHLYGILLACAGMNRLAELNRRRTQNWDILCAELAGCPGVSPVETLPQAVRGGFLEFKFILNLEQVRVDRAAFVRAAQAEGVPLSVDRYGFLHKVPAFRQGGPLTLGLLSAHADSSLALAELPATDEVADRIMTLPAFTDVPERFVHQCGTALRKVAEHYAR